MAKLMTFLRTLFFLFLLYLALVHSQLGLFLSSAARAGKITVDIPTFDAAIRVLWLAVAWVGLEVFVGWATIWVQHKFNQHRKEKERLAAAEAGRPQASGQKG